MKDNILGYPLLVIKSDEEVIEAAYVDNVFTYYHMTPNPGPAFAFTSALDTGIYYAGDHTIKFTSRFKK